MNVFKTLALVGLVMVIFGFSPSHVFADEFTPTLSLVTNSGSFYYKGDHLGDKTIWKAPLLRIRTNLTPFTSYWANHCREIHGIKGKSPEGLYFPRSIITKFVTKKVPSISEDYFKDVGYAIDGSDLCYTASKGVPFKELADNIVEITPLPYHGKLCVISEITKGDQVTGYSIAILDETTGRELQSFNQSGDAPRGGLQWVNDRYILQVLNGRHIINANLIDLEKQKITFKLESDSRDLEGAFVLNGKVMLLSDGALNEYPLKH